MSLQWELSENMDRFVSATVGNSEYAIKRLRLEPGKLGPQPIIRLICDGETNDATCVQEVIDLLVGCDWCDEDAFNFVIAGLDLWDIIFDPTDCVYVAEANNALHQLLRDHERYCKNGGNCDLKSALIGKLAAWLGLTPYDMVDAGYHYLEALEKELARQGAHHESDDDDEDDDSEDESHRYN